MPPGEVWLVFLGRVFAHQAIQQSYGSDDSYPSVAGSQEALYLLATDAGVQVVAGTQEVDGQGQGHGLLPVLLPPKTRKPL